VAGAASGADQVLKVAAKSVTRGVQGTGPTGLKLPVPKAQLRQEAADAISQAQKKAAALKVQISSMQNFKRCLYF